jgi:ATP-dependent DNA helicase PIF1
LETGKSQHNRTHTGTPNSLLQAVLTRQIYRQSDSEFVTALNKARLGKPDTNTLRLFNACQRPLTHMLEIKPTKMYPIRALVQNENSREFEALDTKIHIYTAIDEQSSPDQNTPDFTSVLNDLQATKGLRLRIGAQVMLLANLGVTEGLVNGTRGVVTGFAGMEEALAYAQLQGALRGKGDEAGDEVRGFARGQDMEFPRVLFETKDTTKEVSPTATHFPLLSQSPSIVVMVLTCRLL